MIEKTADGRIVRRGLSPAALAMITAPAPVTAPAVPAPVLTAAQQEAQDIIDKQDYIAMLTSCLPTLKAEHYAARFLMAEMKKEGDVQVKKKQFLKAAKRVTGGLPPFTEVALQLIARQAKKS